MIVEKQPSRLRYLLPLALLLTGLLVSVGCDVLGRSSNTQELNYPTPTSIIDLNAIYKATPELVSLESVLQSTAVPVDYDAIFLAEDQNRKATIEALNNASIDITVFANKRIREISPYVYGVTVLENDAALDLRPSLYNWGGAESSRYNWRLGNTFNIGRAAFYQNQNLFPSSSDFALDFFGTATEIDALTRFSLPTIGWVAKDTFSCSFSDPACSPGRGSTCLSPEVVPNPAITSVQSGPEDILEFVRFIRESGYDLDILGVLDQPELWGITHYDVHPTCTTAEEILETYLAYAEPLKELAPEVELAGPATCCWRYYWDTLGWEDVDVDLEEPFLPWFLQSMAAYDAAAGQRHLDVLDVRFFPRELQNDNIDSLTTELRFRAIRSLYDPLYVDESEINEPIFLIPRLRQMVDEFYPGTKVGLSAWNFGATDSMSGAMTVAEVLGIMGREGLYYASFYPALDPSSPSYYAFKLYSNYDDEGGRFGDIAIEVESSFPDLVSAYASIDSATGDLHIILINKTNEVFDFDLDIIMLGFTPANRATSYTYVKPSSEAEDPGIIKQDINIGNARQQINIQRESIVHVVYQSE